MMEAGAPDIVLASSSPVRAALLEAAGIAHRADPADLDEGELRAMLERGGEMTAADVAEVLARAKAETVSGRHGEALVIGADQTLELDGKLFDKPRDMAAARRTLLTLQGRTHQLHSAIALARAGETVCSQTATAHLTMRTLTPEFIGRYLAAAGEGVLGSVGAYQLEGLGAHLFARIEGDYFTVLGLPLLPLLEALRGEGAIAS